VVHQDLLEEREVLERLGPQDQPDLREHLEYPGPLDQSAIPEVMVPRARKDLQVPKDPRVVLGQPGRQVRLDSLDPQGVRGPREFSDLLDPLAQLGHPGQQEPWDHQEHQDPLGELVLREGLGHPDNLGLWGHRGQMDLQALRAAVDRRVQTDQSDRGVLQDLRVPWGRPVSRDSPELSDPLGLPDPPDHPDSRATPEPRDPLELLVRLGAVEQWDRAVVRAHQERSVQ